MKSKEDYPTQTHHRLNGLRLLLLAILVGSLVALAGQALLHLIHGIAALVFQPPSGSWVWLLAPVAGAALIGLISRLAKVDVSGHGIPEAMQGVIANQSRIRLKTAILKPLCTAICIGTGGPFGVEGPIIATGGAVGSLLGQCIPHSPAQRKILLGAGAAAGMTAMFGTPLAGVLLAVELLLFEFRARSLLPVSMAAATAMFMRGLTHEPFPMLPVSFPMAPDPLIGFASLLVGGVSGLVAVGMTEALHGLESLYEKLPFSNMGRLLLGGLSVGLIGWIDPRTLGPGYANMQNMLHTEIAATALGTLMVLKFASWSLSLASGTAGGTLAPVMTVGGAMGSLAGLAIQHIPGFESLPIGLMALVGMASVFAGMSRALLASVAFAFEATQSSGTFGPLLLGCAIAICVSRLLMRHSIMTEKMAKQGIHVPEAMQPDILEYLLVKDVMNAKPVTLLESAQLDETIQACSDQHSDSYWQKTRLIPIVDEDNRLKAILTRNEILSMLRSGSSGKGIKALHVANPAVISIHNDSTLAQAADLMLLHDVAQLPVITNDGRKTLLGVISRKELLQARQITQQHEFPQPGILAALRQSK